MKEESSKPELPATQKQINSKFLKTFEFKKATPVLRFAISIRVFYFLRFCVFSLCYDDKNWIPASFKCN